VWLAEQRGAVLPPISVASVGDAYAIRDGHHRVSVARVRGALTITAVVA
jgi:ParB-like chromosome segregation protein Spo0J